jgi:crotonobetainyl-CoA:carnitine CoA-transferase CaiB-like acyl-CoA transferase
VTADPPGPLSHLRVPDFTALAQGPLATQILGDLGAGVVKIERVEGEWSRHWGILDGHTHGQTDSFLAFNRNKRAPVQDYDDLLRDPQALYNGMFWEVPIGDGSQSFRAPASPFAFSATPVAFHRGVPDLGARTGEIFGQEDG